MSVGKYNAIPGARGLAGLPRAGSRQSSCGYAMRGGERWNCLQRLTATAAGYAKMHGEQW